MLGDGSPGAGKITHCSLSKQWFKEKTENYGATGL